MAPPASPHRRLVIGLDLDGVCADYIAAIRVAAAAALGVDPRELPEPRSWGFEEWGLTFADFQAIHSRAVTAGRIFAALAPIPGACDAVRRLHSRGDTVRIITNRLCGAADQLIVLADTAGWLKANDLPYDELCFAADKSTVDADVYLDDSPRVLNRLAAANKTAIVFDQPYNQAAPGIRVHNWDQALAAVEQIRIHRPAGCDTATPATPARGRRPMTATASPPRTSHLEGKHVAFTGTLPGVARVDAFKMLRDVDASPQRNITAATDILVVGAVDRRRSGPSGTTGKQRQAAALGLTVLTGHELLAMIPADIAARHHQDPRWG